ncbi:MAG: phosphate ABC transporter permease PstA [Gammaproteobacteria bacterium]|nr:MAG: phosphate ABC transporter permease PstA [Gammaproteobacteria bacterium]
MSRTVKSWLGGDAPWIWLHAGAISLSLLLVAGLLALLMLRGLGHFWPADVAVFELTDVDGARERVIGEIVEHETLDIAKVAQDSDAAGHGLIDRYLIKTGNREISGIDFRWVNEPQMSTPEYPTDIMVLERREWGNFYGFPRRLMEGGSEVDLGGAALGQVLLSSIDAAGGIFAEIRHIEKDLIGAINYRMERMRLRERRLQLEGGMDPEAALAAESAALQQDYDRLVADLESLYESLNQRTLIAVTASGEETEILLAGIVRAYYPNAMSPAQKSGHYLGKLWEFLSEEPREANTEGGIYPAIFGTVLMVMCMALLVTPFGVVAAIYLHEYARQGVLTRLIRIAVNNLAGVPSVVYGVFGLGFFVYFLGGSIDELLFRESLPNPTFGTPGLLWASLTLALLTVPVVIVATEEGLSRVPLAIREGSLALGATKAETLFRTVLPMTAPAILTGMILAIARAAGEVAPLMLVGVVKLAPALPLDGGFPYLHLDRKFMHLGFHIYDVGFQSPNVEAARPLVYATALLLVLVIVALNLAAIKIRNNLREKYRAAE